MQRPAYHFFGIIIILVLWASLYPWSATAGVPEVGDPALPVLGSTSTFPQTPVCGTITDFHWTVAGSPYIVTCNSTLNSGTLVIDPGVHVKFQPGTRLDISRRLVADGTQAQPIVFTSNKSLPVRGDWNGLNFNAGSSDSILKYVLVEYGTGISVANASPRIEYATIRYNASSGIYLNNSGSTVSHSTIISNTAQSGAGVHIAFGVVTLDSNTISWNHSTTRGGGILGYGWSSGATITVINNTITHNSVDSYGGGGILFDSANGLIANNTITDNSVAGCGGGGVNVSGASGPVVTLRDNVIAHNSAGCGGGVATDAYVTIVNNVITGNSASTEGSALRYVFPSGWHGPSTTPVTCNTIVGNTEPSGQDSGIYTTVLSPFHQNTIQGNSGYQFESGSSSNIDSTQNYWGTTDPSQIADGIYDHNDNQNLGIVSFAPFLNLPDPCAPGLTLNLSATPGYLPANGTSPATVTLAGAPAGHRVRLLSSRGNQDVFSPTSGTTNAVGQFDTSLNSFNPGTTVITAQDLTTGETFAASTQVTFMAQSGPPTPPPNSSAVRITDISAAYPLFGRYLQGVSLPNRITVTADWHSLLPGRVDFILNGTPYSVSATSSRISFTLDMGLALQAGSNNLQIIAYAASGEPSTARNYTAYLVPKPIWLSGLQQVGAIAPMILGGGINAGYDYNAATLIPPDGINLGAPGFGPPGSSTELGFFVGGEFSLPLTCSSPVAISASAGANLDLDLLGVGLGGELKGSGILEGRAVQCEIPTLSGDIRIDIKVYGQKNWPVVTFVINFIAPGAGEVIQSVLPYDVLTILGEVYLQGNLRGFFSSGVHTVLEPPYLEWSGVTLGGGPGVETGYQFNKLGVKLKLFLGAYGTVAFNNPNPLSNLSDLHFDEAAIHGEAGYELQVFAWQRGETYFVEWRYPPAEIVSQPVLDKQDEGWRLINHVEGPDYARFEGRLRTGQGYAPTKLPSLGANSTITSVLVSNVYTYTEPSLAVSPSDQALLLWVHDDINKPVGQSQEINFSRWDGTTWSVPAGVTNDFKLDSAPQVAWKDTNQVVAVWQRLDDTLPITATWNITTANQIEIATAIYDAGTSTWSPVTLLTSNTSLDMTPNLAANAVGNLLATWRQNDAGLLSGDTSHPDRIMAAFHDAAWTAPAIAVDSIPGLVDVAAGHGTNTATIAYTRFLTPTGSITPTLQLFASTWNGSVWSTPAQLTDDTLGHTDPQIVYSGANQPLLVWLAGDALRLRNLSTTAEVTLTLPAAIGAIDEFRIVRDATGNIAAVFTAQTAQRDLYLALYDQAHNVWGLPVALTNDKTSEGYPAPALDSTGRLLMGYAQTAMVPVTRTTTITSTGQVVTYTVPTEGQTDLVTLSHTIVRNLTLGEGDLMVSDDHPQPGSSVTISATVHNSGDLALDNVAVAFYDGQPGSGGTLIGNAALPQTLTAGYTATVTTTYTLPTFGGARTLVALADPNSLIAEADETDNTTSLRAYGPDLELFDAGVDYWGGSQVGLVTLVHNIGTTASPPAMMTFHREALTGTVAISDTLPPLAAGQVYTLTTPWDSGSAAGGDHPLIAVVNQDENDFPEVFTDNNHAGLTLSVLPDLAVDPLYLWADFRPDHTLAITATVYNFGPVAASGVTVELYADDPFTATTRIATWMLPELLPASSETVTTVVNLVGQHDLYLWADPQAVITETVRTNNLASVTGCFSIPEDLDCSGQVNVLDIQTIALAWQTANPALDFNGNGIVDIPDIQRVAGRWGEP